MNLETHLNKVYGIKHFDGDDYWLWASETLGNNAERVDRLRPPIVEGNASRAQQKRFHDFIANQPMASVLHSSKADAIRASGEFIVKQLQTSTAILDVGCSIGYLTSYYALMSSTRQVVGCDVSIPSINIARKIAERILTP